MFGGEELDHAGKVLVCGAVHRGLAVVVLASRTLITLFGEEPKKS
jgi:hypothetical protein